MVICGTSNIGFQKNIIIEEKLSTGYIQKVCKTNEYIEKFKEYKIAYRTKWNRAKANNNEQKYVDDIQRFIEDMKPFNKLLKNNEISKRDYLEVLNKRKRKLIY